MSLPVQVNSAVFCAHANSTCSNCNDLCGVSQFYPLLPPPCHPDSSMVIVVSTSLSKLKHFIVAKSLDVI